MIDALEPVAAALLVVALVANGLQAGTYYAWATGVMPGLARVDDATFVAAVRQVNVAIVNPVFLASFLGAPLLTAVALLAVGYDALGWTAAALVLALATVGVTAAGNVPLNDALEAGGDRAAFERPWVRCNLVRTVTSTAALACLGVALSR